MPARRVPHPVVDNALHIYRALLRECTYLPDPAARQSVARHTALRFRHRRLLDPTDAGKSIAKARRALSLLVRANHGQAEVLLKVLQFAYARRGRPRRELVRQLQLPSVLDIPADDAELRAVAASTRAPTLDRLRISSSVLQGHGSSPRYVAADHTSAVRAIPSRAAVPKGRSLAGWPPVSDRLNALVHSQRKQRQSATRQAFPKMDLVVGLNSWGRPMPKVREKNARWKLYRDTLDSVLPPLPEKEWCRLRDLSLGRRRWEGPIARRAREDRYADGSDPTLLTPGFLQAPLGRQRHLIRFRGRSSKITEKLMQKLWGLIFAECPVMRWDADQGSWQVEWGRLPLKLRPATTEIDLQVFSGADHDGKVAAAVDGR